MVLRAVGVAAAIVMQCSTALSQWSPTTRYAVREGLIQGQVTDIVQDVHGYLWIGTEGGLSRFDGVRFTSMDREHGLPDSVVNTLAVRGTEVWAGAQVGGIARTRGGLFEPLEDLPFPATDPVFALGCIDPETVLVGTPSGLYAWRGGDWSQLLDSVVVEIEATGDGSAIAMGRRVFRVLTDLTVVTLDDTSDGNFATAATFSAGRQWLARLRGPIVDLASDARFDPDLADGEEIRAIHHARSGAPIWLGTNRGLYRWDGRTPVDLHPVSLEPEAPRVEVSTLFEDREGTLWIGTWGRGIYAVRDSPWTIFDRSTGMPATSTWSFSEGPDGCVWIGSDDSGAISWCGDRWGPRLGPAEGLPHQTTFALDHDRRGRLWLGGPSGVCRWDGALKCWSDTEVLPDPFVSDLVVSPSDMVWIGTDLGPAVFRDGTWSIPAGIEALRSPVIRDLAVAPNGAVWAVFDRGELAVVTPDGITPMDEINRHLPTGRLWAAGFARDGRILVGTDEGLWIHDPSGSEPDHLVGRDRGLPSSSVISVVETPAGDLWAGTSAGVVRLSDTYEIQDVFTVHHGLSDSEAAQGGLYVTSSGHLWIAMATGATRADLSRIGGDDTLPPDLVVERVLFNGEEVAAFSPRSTTDVDSHPPLHVPPDVSHIRFEFTAPSFTAPDLIRFRHILTADQSEFGTPEPDRHVTVHQPPPGAYRFGLSAITGSGAPARGPLWIDLRVHPPWYHSLWFRVAAVVLLTAALIGVVVRRSHLQEARRTELEDQVRLRTADLDAANRRIQEQNQQLTELSRTDPLTGLGNRRVLAERLPLAMALARRDLLRSETGDLSGFHGLVISILDLDRFKEVNDTWGHEAGDRILQDLARNLHAGLREGDQAVRWGGEEFVILSHGLDRTRAREFVLRVLNQLAVCRWRAPDGTGVTVRASVGFLAYPIGDRDFMDRTQWRRLVELADRLLYEAKARGRHRACGLLWQEGCGREWSEQRFVEALSEAPASPPTGIEFVEIVADP